MFGMEALVKRIAALKSHIDDAVTKLDVAADESALAELDSAMAQPDFWQGTDAAGVSQRAAGLRKHVGGWRELQSQVAALAELAALGDADMAGEIEIDLAAAEAEFAAREFELKLSGPHDRSGATVTIAAGAGGTDAQDWAEMLLRMYLRYAERNGFETAIIDRSDGEEAGIKSVTFEVAGAFAYGKLRSERGVHRLVRLSPFNADSLRQTSFAMVEVIPQLERPDEVEINQDDLRIDVYRSGGKGGQSVNTTDSAVRITHVPTGTVVAIQNERSQLQNKEKAMAILKARLTLLMEQQHKAEISELKGAAQSAEWGSQIRSYVLHPYTQVKDHRTGETTSQAQDVLDGEIEPFIDAFLSKGIGE